MFGCVVSISASSSETFFSPWHTALMIFSRIGVDSTPNSSATESKTWSSLFLVSVGVGLASIVLNSIRNHRYSPAFIDHGAEAGHGRRHLKW